MMILRKEYSSKIYEYLIIQIKNMEINKESGVKNEFKTSCENKK